MGMFVFFGMMRVAVISMIVVSVCLDTGLMCEGLPLVERNLRRVSMVPIAGSGEIGATNGASAETSTFSAPEAVHYFSEHNMYIVADTENHCLRTVTGSTVQSLAGLCGSPGTSDGTGTAARFRSPVSVSCEVHMTQPMLAGQCLVADSSSCTIRLVIFPQGMVQTMAGVADDCGNATGEFDTPLAVLIDPRQNNLGAYVADNRNFVIRRLTPSFGPIVMSVLAGSVGSPGDVDGVSSSARFTDIFGMSYARVTLVTAGQNDNVAGRPAENVNLILYIADGDRIRRLSNNSHTGIMTVTTIFTSPASSLDRIIAITPYPLFAGVDIDSNHDELLVGILEVLSGKIRMVHIGNLTFNSSSDEYTVPTSLLNDRLLNGTNLGLTTAYRSAPGVDQFVLVSYTEGNQIMQFSIEVTDSHTISHTTSISASSSATKLSKSVSRSISSSSSFVSPSVSPSRTVSKTVSSTDSETISPTLTSITNHRYSVTETSETDTPSLTSTTTTICIKCVKEETPQPTPQPVAPSSSSSSSSSEYDASSNSSTEPETPPPVNATQENALPPIQGEDYAFLAAIGVALVFIILFVVLLKVCYTPKRDIIDESDPKHMVVNENGELVRRSNVGNFERHGSMGGFPPYDSMTRYPSNVRGGGGRSMSRYEMDAMMEEEMEFRELQRQRHGGASGGGGVQWGSGYMGSSYRQRMDTSQNHRVVGRGGGALDAPRMTPAAAATGGAQQQPTPTPRVDTNTTPATSPPGAGGATQPSSPNGASVAAPSALTPSTTAPAPTAAQAATTQQHHARDDTAVFQDAPQPPAPQPAAAAAAAADPPPPIAPPPTTGNTGVTAALSPTPRYQRGALAVAEFDAV